MENESTMEQILIKRSWFLVKWKKIIKLSFFIELEKEMGKLTYYEAKFFTG